MIVTKLIGGIGNQMFQYAVGKHLAYKNKCELKLDITHYDTLVLPNNLPYRSFDLSIFNLDLTIASKKELELFHPSSHSIASRAMRKLRNNFIPYKTILEPHFHFYPDLLNQKGNLYIDGYWQSENYFKDITTIIKTDFQVKTTLTNEGNNLLNKIKNTNSVCLNIRRQEFASNRYINQFVGENYIYTAIQLMANKINNAHFFIISDELQWVKENIKIDYPHTFIEENLYGEKFNDCLYFMSNCKHNIIPNSTFGWWGAWLNNNSDKIIVAPKNWLNDSKRDTKDVIPHQWITI